jgi:cell volume regulation protein A
MGVDELGPALLVASAVLLVAVVAVRLSARTGLPSLLLYLGLGLVIGERGLGLRFDDARLTGVLGYAALVVILAEGGVTTRWGQIRACVAPAAVLATLGTTVSVVVTAVAAHWLLDVPWVTALLLGAVVSSTDAAAVFSVLRTVPLPARLTGLLEAESGFNDAPVVILVVALVAEATDGGGHAPWLLVAEAAGELAVDAARESDGARLLRGVALPSSGLYPIAVLGLAGAAFGAADVLHGSGFLATYLAALVLGNARLPHGAAVRGFAEGMGWMAQIGLFVLLGLLADPARLPGRFLPGVVVGLAVVLLARPLAVLLSVTWFRVGWREQVFLSWAGLRGAVPIVLATIPLAQGVPDARRIFDLVFVLVVVLTLVQGPTLPWAARRLRLAGSVTTVGLDVESSPLGALDADVLTVRIGPESALHGVELFELRLPERANVTLVVRDGEPFVPQRRAHRRDCDGCAGRGRAPAAGGQRRRQARRLAAAADGAIASAAPPAAARPVDTADPAAAVDPSLTCAGTCVRVPAAGILLALPSLGCQERSGPAGSEPGGRTCRRTPTRAPRAVTASRCSSRSRTQR